MPTSPRSRSNIHPLPSSHRLSVSQATLKNDDWDCATSSPVAFPAMTPSLIHPAVRAVRSHKTSPDASPSPSRLFLRTPIPHDSPSGLHFALGPYNISINLTPIDASIINAAKQKIEQRREKLKSEEHPSVMGRADVNVVDPARMAVNGVFEYEYNETDDQAPKLAGLSVTHRTLGKKMWHSAPGVNFVGAAHVNLSVYENRDAKVLTCRTSIQEHVLKAYNLQTIDSFEYGPANAITLRGQLGSEIINGSLEESAVNYSLVFSLVDHENDGSMRKDVTSSCDKALAFKLHVMPTAKTFLVPNQTHLFGITEKSEAFYGFGHRLSNSNAKGMEVHVLNQSTDFSNSKEHNKSTKSSSSCTVPQFVTSNSRCLYLNNTEPSVFDLRSNDWFSIRVQCNAVSGVFIGGNNMLDTLRIYTYLRGRTKMPPSWVQRNGAIVGISGGTTSVRTVIDRLQRAGCPIAGVLVHDWSGIVDSTSSKSRIWYNWIMERGHYKHWHKMVADLDAAGINLGIYLSPMVEEIPVHLRSGRRYLFGEGLKKGHFVRSSEGPRKKEKSHIIHDKEGEIYELNKKKSETRVGLLDVTSYEACQWWKRVIQDEVMTYAGASFWMAGNGELAPIANSVYHTRAINGLLCHNAYAESWARVNQEAIRDAGREGDSFFLVNSGCGHTPNYAASTCLGDQVVNYKSKDAGGLQAVLNGLVNGGFSGFTYGHCAVSFAVPQTLKSLDGQTREMISRWMEMMAFTCLFRTHDTNDGVSTVSAYNDSVLLRDLSKWSMVYSLLAAYRGNVSSEASYRGYPIVRHPVLHFPLDEEFTKSRVSSFLLGDCLYIAPVMKYGVSKAKVHLPEGKWIHLWTDTPMTVSSRLGTTVEVKCPIGKPPVFWRNDQGVGEINQFISDLRRKGMICPEKPLQKGIWRSLLSKN